MMRGQHQDGSYETKLYGWRMDGTESQLCQMVNNGKNNVELLGSITREGGIQLWENQKLFSQMNRKLKLPKNGLAFPCMEHKSVGLFV